jgi:copper chaperone
MVSTIPEDRDDLGLSKGTRMVATSTFHVAGMTCGHCVAAVREEVSSIPHVTAVDVDLESGRVEITAEDDVDDDAVRAAVEEAGYEVTS